MRRLRGVSVVTVLAAALAIVAALAFQGWRVEQGRRASTTRALHEFAGFAAWEFASNAREGMWQAMTELLRPVEQLSPHQTGTPLPPPEILVRSHERVLRCECAYDIPARYYFRLDLESHSLATTGAAAPPAEQRWLIDTVTQHAQRLFDRSWRVATVVGSPDGDARTIAYGVVRDSGGNPAAAYGVVSESNAFMAAMGSEMAGWNLLPPALALQGGTDTLVSILVRDDQGHVVYRSPWQFANGYTASYPLTNFVAGFTVEATLRPDVAGRIIPAGPSLRLPVLLMLLALTLALGIVALRQLQRESALARLRANFVSSVSHELRTPLAQIRMFAELLRMGWSRSDTERDRSLEIIDQESRRLALLVDRVLTFDGTERQSSTVVRELTEVGALVDDVLETFAPVARARGVTVQCSTDARLVAAVDPCAMRQIILNLLDNAVKYGPVGQTITVHTRAHGAFARISVQDEGPGIPDAERELVWEPFRRLDRDANSQIAGSGIGLAVVQRLTAAHGGNVRVEQANGGGARFIVDIPREITAAPVEHHTDVVQPTAALHSAH